MVRSWVYHASRRLVASVSCASILMVSARRVSLELRTKPLFECQDCQTELLDEQNEAVATLESHYPAGSVHVVDRTTKLVNAIFVDIEGLSDENIQDVANLTGALHVYPSDDWEMMGDETASDRHADSAFDAVYSEPLLRIGLDDAVRDYCATGAGVTVAVLDGGIDYTHASMGGEGTLRAFTDAYGTGLHDGRNKHRDGLFPTRVVVEGYDFMGDAIHDGDSSISTSPDDDPIDVSGHGTGVAHAVRAVAPAASLVAVKICTTTGNTCPDFAYLKGLEYILDPNGDGKTDDAVDIVNISLGREYVSSYYSILAKAVEQTFAHGVLPVLSAGNNGNVPFILGGAPATPNALTVGSTEVFNDNSDAPADRSTRVMAAYSSRGPAEANFIKPDLVAPGGPFGLAAAGTGDRFRVFRGTSFSAPLVAGAAAVLKQKCPECSPFALKTLLMNQCEHMILRDAKSTDLAPVTMQGSGEIQLARSLAAKLLFYSVEDSNPSISLGVINAAADQVIRRTIRITALQDGETVLRPSFTFRSNVHADAVSIRFEPQEVSLNGGCGKEVDVTVVFSLNAARAPRNHMRLGGSKIDSASSLNWNEADGWIQMKSALGDAEATMPFHMVLRRAANVSLAVSKFDHETISSASLPMDLEVKMTNHGAEVAQVDAFQLIHFSADDQEESYGSSRPPSDLRYVGYRSFEVEEPGCSHLIEFAIQTWERQLSLSNTHFNLWIDVDRDDQPDFSIFNAGSRSRENKHEIRAINLHTSAERCIAFPPDHASNTANTVLRFCSDDIDLRNNTIVNVAITSHSTSIGEHSDEMSLRSIDLLHPSFRVPSYDIEPGASLQNISLAGTGVSPNGQPPLGLMFVTNAYRSITSTGAATRQSETVAVVDQRIVLPRQATEDVLTFPVATDFTGPRCSWGTKTDACLVQTGRGRALWPRTVASSAKPLSTTQETFLKASSRKQVNPERRMAINGAPESCEQSDVPRLKPIVIRSEEWSISPTSAPVSGNATQLDRSQNTGNLTTMGSFSSNVPPLSIDEELSVRSGYRTMMQSNCALIALLIVFIMH